MCDKMKEAIKELESNRYHVANMFDGFTSTISDEYEIIDNDGNICIDHLSQAQVIQLAEILR